MGTVTVEGTGLGEVTVTLQGEGEEDETSTNAAGQFSFTDLHAGEYSIGITGFDDDEYGFDVTTATVTVALQETASVPFEGIMLRTAGIAGTVTVEGHAIPGVTVTVTGGPKDEEHETMTNDAGYYMVDDLHAGDYAVAISDFDANEYEFEATTQSVSVGLRETATVAFQGELLRTAGISGRVSVEGMGLDGIMVTLSGDADMTAETADGGQYAFTGLAEGDYTVAIAGWDTLAYSFDMSEADLEVAQDAAVVQNFEGMHTRTASVSGMLFLDEVNADGMHTEGEPPLAMSAEMMAALTAAGIPGVPLLLQGPGVNDVQYGFVMPDGSYAFEGLMAGSYRVLINMTDTLAAAISHFGFRFSGELTGQVVNVAAAEAAMVNFPFRITMQTIVAGAVLGYADSASHGLPMVGVSLELYPNADDADNGTNMLGMATTDTLGIAVFHFPRAMDTGPGGQGTDHLVFLKYMGAAIPGIVASDNEDIEITYASTARVSQAPTAVRVLNTVANFQWWVKSNADARDGNEFLEGWTATNGVATDEDGLAKVTVPVAVDDLPMTFEVGLHEEAPQPDGSEMWTQSDMLSHSHTGLEHPVLNTHMANDLGAIYVTWTTQSLTLGVYREADDVEGYSDYRSPLPRGDHRPAAGVGNGMTVELMVRDDRGRLQTLEYDHDLDEQDPDVDDPTDRIEAKGDFGAGGMKTFTHLPAGEEITVRFRVGANRVLVSEYSDIETFGQDLDLGATVGAFGDMSGAGPEVRLCTASSDSSDDWCATYGYQWMTGMVSGYVGNESGHAVVIDATSGHGATGDSTGTTSVDGGPGNYSVSGLQDGEYEVMAISGSEDYSIAVTTGSPNPAMVAVYHDEYADEEDEEGMDTTWVGIRGTDGASWMTTRQGLSVRGYVGNDDGDNLMRGDEAIEGVTVTLYRGGRISTVTGALGGATRVGSTTTDADGYYAFDDLADAGATYRVIASGGSGYRAWRTMPARRSPGNISGATAAMVYPELPTDTDLAKPQWTGTTTTNATSMYTDDQGTTDTDDDVTGVWQNFALVWENGTVAGTVSNSSGADGNIDVRITTPFGGAPVERTTATNGGFELDNALEGTYTATIEDVGWAAPKVDSATGMPDDDAADWDSNGDGTVDSGEGTAPTQLSGMVSGRNDYQGLGTLHVYSTTASANDTLGAGVRVRWSMHGTDVATYNDTTSTDATAGWSRVSEPSTDNTSNIGTISWQSESVGFVFGTRNGAIPLGSSWELDVSPSASTAAVQAGQCSTYSCDLGFNKTGSAVADNLENTITVTMTAANGYNDHVYSLLVSRQNPVGNDIAAANIARADTTDLATHTAADAGANGFTFTTTGASSVNLIFTLETFGDEANENAYCAQRVSVRATGGNAVAASDDDDDDVCPATRYRLSATTGNGTPYTVTITSEDGATQDYSLRVIDGA
ncbi:MAG: carboxypeptidase regulatory-like domain-containing protein [Gemmatimonadota bacterium]|nr:carboxypeptidase regulatory-like domain-containing protein [Gemmatimonadota bacterium]